MRDVERFPIQLAVNDPGGSRTRDLRIKSPLLYQLSYRVSLLLSTYDLKLNGIGYQHHATCTDGSTRVT